MENFEAALTDFNPAIDMMLMDDHSSRWRERVYSRRGRAYLGPGRYPEAFTDFDEVVRIRPDKHWPNARRAHVRRFVGDHAGAIEAADKALSLKPGFGFAYEQKVGALTDAARYDEALMAIDAWEKALGRATTETQEAGARVEQKKSP